MTIGAQCLISTVSTRLTTASSGTLSCCQLQNAQTALNNTKFACASSVSALPTASCNVGRLVYLTDTCSFVISNGTNWVSDFNSNLKIDQLILWSWGGNNTGERGDSNTAVRCSPASLSDLVCWSTISLASQHTMFLAKNGTIWTTGRNNSGQLGNSSGVSRSSPGTIAGNDTTWAKISAGQYNSAGIKTDGTLWTWGDNTNGRLGNNCTSARSSPGTIAGGGTNWSVIKMGVGTGGGVKTDGTLWTWGLGAGGILGHNAVTSRSSPGTIAGGGTDWCNVSLSTNHAMGIKLDGTIWTWGCNNVGQLGDNTVVSRSSPGTVAGGGTDWSYLSVTNSVVNSDTCVSSYAIKLDGTLWSWGGNYCGRLGANSAVSRSSPGTIAGGGTTWCKVIGSTCTAIGLKTDSTIWTWGANSLYALGTGNNTPRSSPGTVAGCGIGWLDIALGPCTGLGLRIASNITKGF